MISLACVGIQNEGNIGAIARVMKNFGADGFFKNLLNQR